MNVRVTRRGGRLKIEVFFSLRQYTAESFHASLNPNQDINCFHFFYDGYFHGARVPSFLCAQLDFPDRVMSGTNYKDLQIPSSLVFLAKRKINLELSLFH